MALALFLQLLAKLKAAEERSGVNRKKGDIVMKFQYKQVNLESNTI